MILPARVRGFRPEMLDELGASGWLLWVGHAPLGKEDGKVLLYRRERFPMLHDTSAIPDSESFDGIHRRLLDALADRGACFFVELEQSAEASRKEVVEAVWDLVWQGVVTNDTFQSLRGLRNRNKRTQSRGRRSDPFSLGGRWSLVSKLSALTVTPTEQAHARALMLLDRHGLVTRSAAALELLPGGFTPIYRVLKLMEETGKVRRGYFVEGIGGAQFGYAGVVDRIRATKDQSEKSVMSLAATDPANPFGWLIPWPNTTSEGRGPRRLTGATLILVNGVPVLFLDSGGKRLRTFEHASSHDIILAAEELRYVARQRKGRLLRIDQIDGSPARASDYAEALREASFTFDHRGLLVEAQ